MSTVDGLHATDIPVDGAMVPVGVAWAMNVLVRVTVVL